ncbi:unnamed protein product [Miscanthus lutarioriparius]|uniref:Leucine-rich repeat-containing N-terminal plant-type domain-containing protein n=1 Tax=Miscanthus lutarioriparius TaxID=422564 RepID=A0A811PAK1_9POAL|nr:unnamed protein product [Miscanthus lutarioriparius]
MAFHELPVLLLQLLQIIQLVVVLALCSLVPPGAGGGAYTNHTTITASVLPCLPDQALALLQLKQSFSVTNYSTMAFRSWRPGTDCCGWEAVHCDHSNDGHVTSLDLGDCGLLSGGLSPALFKLTLLRYLNLGGNCFNGSQLPAAGFERLTELTHLNLSSSSFSGEIPTGIGSLRNLVSLDLSAAFDILDLADDGYSFNYAGNWLVEPNLARLIANLSSLLELRAGFVDLSNNPAMEWCNALANYTPNLQVLSLPFCQLHGPISASLSRLSSLVLIDLRKNHLDGPIPQFFANFSFLEVLQLSRNHHEGWVSPKIFEQKKLRTVDLSNNIEISGILPNFSADSRLKNLLLGNTNFSGTIPSSISNLQHLKKLALGGRGFSGEIPSSMGQLTSLKLLEVSGFGLVGPVPAWVTNLTSLLVLQFSNCGLSGPIPSFIGNLPKLRKLALFRCNFLGEIPQHISNLTHLNMLLLYSNNLVGTVQLTPLWKLPKLFDLNLSNNLLNVVPEDQDNSSLASLPPIKYLGLASCNISEFPNDLRNLDQINGLDISNNYINGAVPQWVWEKWSSFSFLNLSHNNFTSMGYDYPILPIYVQYFDLSFNNFQGAIPLPQEANWLLDYSSNQFSTIPSNFGTFIVDTESFKASGNKLSGEILAPICTAWSLNLLDLSYNNLNGSIPTCLMEDLNSLQVLNLAGNQLHGELPHSMKEECSLRALGFGSNKIEGKIPRSLVACQWLEILDIGNNQISDSFPCWMSKLPKLRVLVLKSNNFTGHLGLGPSVAEDRSNCDFLELRVVDLASNNLYGTLPEEWFSNLKSMTASSSNETFMVENRYPHGQAYRFTVEVTVELTHKGHDIAFSNNLVALVFIDVSSNLFHGEIPKSIGDLVYLSELNMSHNALTGPIPNQLGRLNQLESLDLSSNELSGEIPQELASLDFLTTLNLSDNMLVGRIPESIHFGTFTNDSFLGNDGLCGPPLSKGCSNGSNIVPHPLNEKPDIILFLFTGLGFGVGFAFVIVVTWGICIRK